MIVAVIDIAEAPVVSGSTCSIQENKPDDTFVCTVAATNFTLEIILKVVAFGFLYPKDGAYCRSGWNILDIIVVFFSILGFLIKDSKLAAFRTCKKTREINCKDGCNELEKLNQRRW